MDKVKYAILGFVGALIAIYVVIFYSPDQMAKLALFPEKMASGEYWRVLTFQFSHLNTNHLIENIGGAGLAAGIATQLKMKLKVFSWTYLLAGMLAVIPVYLFAPFVALGASGAIYGAFGAVSLDAKKFGINSWILIGLLAAAILVQVFLLKNIPDIQQGAAHLSGLLIGAGLFLSYDKVMAVFTKKRRRVLRG